MSNPTYRIGVVGAAGYTGGELLRLLVDHPNYQIAFAQSESQAGKPISVVHPDLLGQLDMNFAPTTDLAAVDGVFLCGGHDRSATFIASHAIPSTTKLVDLSRDYRADDNWTYGLTEANREAVANSNRIANPGCFATAIQLALLPLARAGQLQSAVHIHALTGSTGAGQRPVPTTHFSYRNNNVSIYKAFRHQHLDEIKRSLHSVSNLPVPQLHFLPIRGNFSRGIYASLYLQSDLSTETAQQLFTDYYGDAAFVHLSPVMPSVKQVTGTNNAVLYVERIDEQLLIVSAIDNLLKGAAGQALQNMNLMLGLPDTVGLQLRSIAY